MKCYLVGLVWLLVAPAIALAEDSVRSIELFAGMESRELDVVMVAPSPRNIYLRVTNNTQEMVNIELPDSFLGLPVLAQFQPPGGLFGPGFGNGPGLGNGLGRNGAGNGLGLGNAQGQGNGSGSQALGGGFQQGAMQGIGNGANGVGNGNPWMNGNNFQRGMFRVPAGRTSKVSATTVCLEFGKPDPNSLIKYRIVPLRPESGIDPRLVTLCRWIGERRVSQPVAQAIAWHVTDKLSWEHLATLDRVQSKYTGNQKFFTTKDLDEAMRLLETLDEPKLVRIAPSLQSESGYDRTR